MGLQAPAQMTIDAADAVECAEPSSLPSIAYTYGLRWPRLRGCAMNYLAVGLWAPEVCASKASQDPSGSHAALLSPAELTCAGDQHIGSHHP